MIKFPNLIKAAGIMLTLVWGLYGNQSIIKAVPTADIRFVDPYEEAEMAPKHIQVAPVPLKGIFKYPTVAIDLTRGASRSETLSAPLKSDGLP